MKRYSLFAAFLFVLPILGNATDDTQPVTTSIEEVTVFRSGAQITRQATITLSPGRNEIFFEGLTYSLQDETIQLSGSGDFMILSLAHRQNYLDEHPQQERLGQLRTRRDSLERQIEEQEMTKSILQRETDILLSNTNLKGNQQNLSASELKQAMDYFHEKFSDLEAQKLAINRKLEQLREELQKVKKQISELDNSASQNSSVITAVLQSETEQQVQLTLTYLVAGAGWEPSYDVRVGDIGSPLNLSYKANVHQSTGIDWNNVSLGISSAVPDQGGTLPQLQPWYVRFYEPQARNISMDAEMSLNETVVTSQQKIGAMPVPVQELQGRTSFSYRIDLPYDVPSGGKPLTVEINNEDISADYQYYTVPKRRSAAYLTAKVGEWSQYNLLPGNANLFFENTYVGESSVNPRTVGDTLSFSLGKDESIVTERKKLKEFQEKNFFGNKVRESFAWEISVRNSKDRSIRIEVVDQVPVSQNEDINVSLEESSGADYNRQTGMLRWQLQVASGATEKIRFEYEVEYPKGKEVTF